MMKPGQYGPGSGTANSGYRFGYNGKERDNNGELGLTTYDYGFRIYNPGIGRFLSVDPLTDSYPWYTPYQFAGNQPVWAIDLDGAEEKVITATVGKAAAPVLTLVEGETLALLLNAARVASVGALFVTAVLAPTPTAGMADDAPLSAAYKKKHGAGTPFASLQFPTRKSDYTRFIELSQLEAAGGLNATEDAEYQNLIARGLGKLTGDNLNWSSKSEKTFGHIFSEHGKKRALTSLADRARAQEKKTGIPTTIGQWLDDAKAADFIKSVYRMLGDGENIVDIPAGLGRTIASDGTVAVSSATKAIIVKNPNGSTNALKTAFPIDETHGSFGKPSVNANTSGFERLEKWFFDNVFK